MDAPLVVGETLVLRPWRNDEAGWYVGARDEEIFRFTKERRELTVEEAEVAFRVVPQDPTAVCFAIADRETDQLLGNLPVRLNDGLATLSYWVAPTARGRGVATEALRLASSWIDDTFGRPILELEIHPENVGSRRVAERVGYVDAGTRTSCAECADERGQVVIYRRNGSERG
jgi:ribosomal-protein-alanine N-acetyltransferase